MGKRQEAKIDKATILVVDDNELNRDVLHALIMALGHVPLLAENGLYALTQMEKQPPDLVLLDILMPEMDGYKVLNHMKNDSFLRNIPVIIISAVNEMESVVQCIEMGADDYMVKPFDPTLLGARIGACLEKKRLRDQKDNYFKQIEDYNLKLEERVHEQVQQITVAQQATIFALAKLAASRNLETGEHLQRMCEYSRVLSEKLRLLPKYASVIDEDFIRNIYAASPLHDIGKVAIPDRILLKIDKLTEEEYNIMKTHTIIGGKTLREVDQQHPGNDFVHVGIEIAETHHERWDGNGYPYGLAGEDIPLAGRILALGDVYDAQTSERVYKEAFSHDRSREIILSGSGKNFDSDIVEAFVSAEDEFIAISKRYVDIEKETTFLSKR
ncbi:MAG: response regulator [Candidatus Scalindua sediminis]|nr:response regulator [Candidatus Scalindua sediminis]